MDDFLTKLERRFGRYAIPHLTGIMIGLMAVGYILSAVNSGALGYFTLNPEQIFHGQIWRIVTWVLVPPSRFTIFTIIMMVFYLSIGMSLERALGDFRYNVYIFGGLIISLLAAIITYFCYMPFYPDIVVGQAIGAFFSTYYICTSILLAYAATFPDAVVLLMFVIPVRMKYFGFIYAAFMIYDAVSYIRLAAQGGQISSLYFIPVIAMAASLVNFGLFFFSLKKRVHLTPEQKRRQKEFRRQVLQADARNQARAKSGESPEGGATVVRIVSRHRCEVCGRTEITNPELEFRYCSKCIGAHEYCMEHLYTHQHIQAGQ